MLKFMLCALATLVALCAVQVAIVLGVRSTPRAEYWLYDFLAVKTELVRAQQSPRILILGGSSSLFGIDAAHIQTSLKRPAFNLGLHAGLSLDQILLVGRNTARRGDLIVLTLEPVYYSCASTLWSSWQVRNGVAWNRAYFDSKPLGERVAAVLEGGDVMLPVDILASWVQGKFHADRVRIRLEAMQPDRIEHDLASIRSHTVVPFDYGATSLDLNGDIVGADSADFSDGSGYALTEPGHICPKSLQMLKDFEREMSERGVSVVVAHVPYLNESPHPAGWLEAEQNFQTDLHSAHLQVLDNRDELFFSARGIFQYRRSPEHQVANRANGSIGASAVANDQGGSAWYRLDRASGYDVAQASIISARSPVAA